MGIFSQLFKIFRKNKNPHKALLNQYIELNHIAELLHKELQALRALQKSVVNQQLADIGNKAKGSIGVQKALFIEEELLQQLKYLANKAEGRFREVSSDIPLSPLEEAEISRVMQFLKDIRMRLPNLEEIKNLTSHEKLEKIELALRKVDAVSKQFHAAKEAERELIRRVVAHEINPLLVDIYQNPKIMKNGSQDILVYRITQGQLTLLEKEARKINKLHDPNNKIQWRHWWRKSQKPEKDKTTPLKEPHINMTIKLFGGKKKKIHLLVA